MPARTATRVGVRTEASVNAAGGHGRRGPDGGGHMSTATLFDVGARGPARPQGGAEPSGHCAERERNARTKPVTSFATL